MSNPARTGTPRPVVQGLILGCYAAAGIWLGSINASVETEGPQLLVFAIASIVLGFCIPRWWVLLMCFFTVAGVAAGGDEENAVQTTLIVGAPSIALLIAAGVAARRFFSRRSAESAANNG